MKTLFVLIALLGSLTISAQHELIEAACFNSPGDEYCVREVKGKQYFISDRPDSLRERQRDITSNRYFTDIYEISACGREEAKLVKNSLGEDVSINSSWYDGPISYSEKDAVLFFSNTSEGYVHGKMGIYWSKELTDGSFTDPKAFPLNSSEYSCMHPFYDEASKRLYFVSDVSADSTGFDLYSIPFDGVAFGKLDTLSSVNSIKNELFPVIVDGVLYFSSDREGGSGGIDLYKLEGEAPVALVAPFNTVFDDFAITFTTSQRGYFASNRGEGGDDDIYEFYLPNPASEPLVNIEINPVIQQLEELLSNAVPNSTEALILQAAIDKLKEQENAISELKMQLIAEQERIMDYADSASYLTFDERVNLYQNVVEGNLHSQQTTEQIELPEDVVESLEESRNIQQKAEMIVASEEAFVAEKLVPFLEEKPLEIGHMNEIIAHYDMDNATVAQIMATTYPFEFYFAFDHFDLTEEQLAEVRKFIEVVNGYNGTITITGHTDDRGSVAYNSSLSERRAGYIAKLLVKEGFDEEKIILIGKGESEPAYTNDTKEGRAKNRRVVISL